MRLAAVNIDGVLLTDTFSPVIHRFITRRGAEYSADVEREIFSQPQHLAAKALGVAAGLDWSVPELLEAFFEERDAYLSDHPLRVQDGAVELLRRLRAQGLQVICYGGLRKEHFDRFLGEWEDLFDGPRYVCTDEIRPGIREISADVFGLGFDQVLFIDDVARVAEAARELDVAFIGHASDFEHGFQGVLMREAGVRHLVTSPAEIDEELLCLVDAEAAAGAVWIR
ncbi:haloacid dehalogenase-like hydrolase [Streptomyces abyssalis]|uniref:Haloacid dehalogenase-like hydrolase n=1 Tax=Streptomyces abyssalis TaxID=933944 RepID=A0A1E7JIP0_9ACTN|nr:haloacid dehalogenase-like hydrolase [Streptomyces abyssalis]OEU86328.1 haloacid dehalogenase-like hydrolase [Streptomyces abyssalis]OEU93322.1 haloacid dehalogenase-like hydrolase [Streptomyces abyssalis]